MTPEEKFAAEFADMCEQRDDDGTHEPLGERDAPWSDPYFSDPDSTHG